MAAAALARAILPLDIVCADLLFNMESDWVAGLSEPCVAARAASEMIGDLIDAGAHISALAAPIIDSDDYMFGSWVHACYASEQYLTALQRLDRIATGDIVRTHRPRVVLAV